MTPLYTRIAQGCKGLRNPDLRRQINCLLHGQQIQNIQEACRLFGISRVTYYRWLHRLIEGSFDPQVLAPRSRRPHDQPRRIEGDLREEILRFREEFHYGPARIAWYLRRQDKVVSANGVYKVLRRAGMPFRRRRDQKPNRHTKRYELDRPGQGLQVDIKFTPFLIEGQKGYVFNAIDECSRWRFQFAYRCLGQDPAVDFAQRLEHAAPFPIESVQTDNDFSFTDRFWRTPASDPTARHPFDEMLETLQILHKLIPPGIKELNGKVERSHKTDDQEFYWKLPLDISWDRFQLELARWTYEYNAFRHHSSLGMRTPAEKLADFGYALPPLAPPLTPQPPVNSHYRWILQDLVQRPPQEAPAYLHIRRTGTPRPIIDPLRRAQAYAELSSTPLPPLCHLCGNTTFGRGDFSVSTHMLNIA
jgi:transposase